MVSLDRGPSLLYGVHAANILDLVWPETAPSSQVRDFVLNSPTIVPYMTTGWIPSGEKASALEPPVKKPTAGVIENEQVSYLVALSVGKSYLLLIGIFACS
jgi:hypothetical protein